MKTIANVFQASITTECKKTAIFQLFWSLDISKLVERELYTVIYHRIDLFLNRSN